MSSSFEELKVWKKSCSLTIHLYELLRNCHDYGLKDQMLRASVSIASNIAEGSERGSVKDFLRFLNIAKGSAAELRTQIYISSQIKIFSSNDAKDLIREIKSISKMLQALTNALSKNREL